MKAINFIFTVLVLLMVAVSIVTIKELDVDPLLKAAGYAVVTFAGLTIGVLSNLIINQWKELFKN